MYNNTSLYIQYNPLMSSEKEDSLTSVKVDELLHEEIKEMPHPPAVSPHKSVEKKVSNRVKEKKKRDRQERTIGEVVDIIVAWRRYHQGVQESDGIMAYSLEDAAKKVGLKRKTLDDYLLQIRKGKKCGFRFDLRSNESFGVLRAENKKHATSAKLRGKSGPGQKPS